MRLRLIDLSRLKPNTLMPPYYRTENLTDVAPAYQGKPILDAQQIEDVLAFLARQTEPK
jgi:sulfur-oxidizing protein SoxX